MSSPTCRVALVLILWLSIAAYWLPALLTGWVVFAVGLTWQLYDGPATSPPASLLILSWLLLMGFSLFLAIIAREFASLTLAERRSRRDYSRLKTYGVIERMKKNFPQLRHAYCEPLN